MYSGVDSLSFMIDYPLYERTIRPRPPHRFNLSYARCVKQNADVSFRGDAFLFDQSSLIDVEKVEKRQ